MKLSVGGADTDNRELPGGQNNLSEAAQEVSLI